MSSARRTAALGLVAVGFLTLTGCDKPSPTVTVFSGGSSTLAEAQCWSRSDAPVNTAACSSEDRVGSIKVRANQTIGISVDSKIADKGWLVAIGQSQLVRAPITKTYFRFQLSSADLASGPLRLQIVAIDKTGKAPLGRWQFDITSD